MSVDETVTAAISAKTNVEARGLAIIVTNDYDSSQPLLEKDQPPLLHLKGTEKDGKSMRDAFHRLGFVVHWEHNITFTRLLELVHEITTFDGYHRFKRYKCIAFVFSGHGDQGDYIYLQDGSKMSIGGAIIEPFLPKSSPEMGHLQKLFFFDACRGKLEMEGTMVPRSASSKGKDDALRIRGGKSIDRIKVPEEGGFLIAYSTLSKYQAFESKQGGEWLQRLAAKISESRGSIEDVLTQVNTDLIEANLKIVQQPERLSRLNKVVYLHPDKDHESAGLSCGGLHYKKLTSQHPMATFSDHPYTPPGLNVTYYRSRVSVYVNQPVVGDSKKYFLNTQLSRDEAARDALSQLAETDSAPVSCNSQVGPVSKVNKPSQESAVGSNSSPENSSHMQPPDPSIRQQEVSCESISSLEQMNIFFQKNGVRPRFEFQSDGPKRHRCIVRYTLNGQQKKVDSGHFYLSKSSAKEQVAKRILSKENELKAT